MNCTKIQLFLENSIAYQNQTLFSEKLQALLLSLKEQKTEDNSWFYCKQVQGMPLRTPPGAVVYQGRVDAELTGIQFNAALLKEKLQHRCFPVNLAKFLRTPTLFTEHLWAVASDFIWCVFFILSIIKDFHLEKSRFVRKRSTSGKPA